MFYPSCVLRTSYYTFNYSLSQQATLSCIKLKWNSKTNWVHYELSPGGIIINNEIVWRKRSQRRKSGLLMRENGRITVWPPAFPILKYRLMIGKWVTNSNVSWIHSASLYGTYGRSWPATMSLASPKGRELPCLSRLGFSAVARFSSFWL